MEFDGIERQVGERADLAIIWLHGLGADGYDFVPVADALSLPCGVRFVFPHAPRRPVTINGGLVMRAWYDITGFSPDSPDDDEGLAASVDSVQQLIDRESDRGLGRNRILLAGFSQGGAVALHAGLGIDGPIGGIVGLSTYLPMPQRLRQPIASDTPVLLMHGTADPVIPIALAERSAEWLTAAGIAVDWHTYPMGHEVTIEELNDIGHWLARFRFR